MSRTTNYDADKLLIEAINNGDLKGIKKAIADGANVNREFIDIIDNKRFQIVVNGITSTTETSYTNVLIYAMEKLFGKSYTYWTNYFVSPIESLEQIDKSCEIINELISNGAKTDVSKTILVPESIKDFSELTDKTISFEAIAQDLHLEVNKKLISKKISSIARDLYYEDYVPNDLEPTF